MSGGIVSGRYPDEEIFVQEHPEGLVLTVKEAQYRIAVHLDAEASARLRALLWAEEARLKGVPAAVSSEDDTVSVELPVKVRL